MDIRKLSDPTAEKLRSNPELVKLESLAGAFALIATADGDVDRMESSKFLEIVRETGDLQQISAGDAESAFDLAIKAIKTDSVAGSEAALNAVSAAKGDHENVELILVASQAAIVADLQLVDTEEKVLRQICEALGVDPEAH